MLYFHIWGLVVIKNKVSRSQPVVTRCQGTMLLTGCSVAYRSSRSNQEIQTYAIALINALFLKAPEDRRQVSGPPPHTQPPEWGCICIWMFPHYITLMTHILTLTHHSSMFFCAQRNAAFINRFNHRTSTKFAQFWIINMLVASWREVLSLLVIPVPAHVLPQRNAFLLLHSCPLHARVSHL